MDNAPRRARAFTLPGPLVVDQCRLDTMVLGADGARVRPCLAVIITPRLMPGPHFSYALPPLVDSAFRELADRVRDTLEAGQ